MSTAERSDLRRLTEFGQVSLKAWWSLAGKLILKGGDVAATTAGITEDAATVVDSSQSVLTRVGAAASIVSEAAPVSARDVSGAYKTVKRFFGGKPKCC